MADTMKSLGVIAATKKLTLSYVVQSDVPESVWGDPLRLRQVIVNLVGNAIKFTHEGEIAVVVSRVGEKVRFDVRDTGIGIAPDLRKRIFEPFTQADTSHSRRYGGTGLGLSIVARLLEVMGGAVDVASEQGAGSVFSFVVPLTADAIGAAPQRRPWESQLAGRSVIIVEPAEMSRMAIKEVLRSRGVFATACGSVAEAPRGRFACAITADPSMDVQPQVVISSPLTPGPYPVQVTRPIGESELIDAVGIALGLASQVVEYTREPSITESTSRQILLVDDNEVNREVIAELLTRLGHGVTTARDGEEALVLLQRSSFDLILMDVQLPGIDGLEVTRRFRARGRSTPVIALTAHSSREDRERCLEAGMNGVLVKPVDGAALAAAISGNSRPESLLDVVGGSLALLTRVRDAFRRQTPALMTAIREAVARGDAEGLARAAHTLKGSLSHFPQHHGGALAVELEAAAKGGDLHRAAGLLPALEAALEGLTKALALECGGAQQPHS
jgi:CheY-like chemotaxis protein